ncbi:MAG: bifunctional DNA-formamidopyrimidine glycosylase/DNA-(apurinic or apyrimidinic site) lyase, partial [Myxococcota bacterium]
CKDFGLADSCQTNREESQEKMPELPEVETVCRGLRRVLLGRKVVSVEVVRARCFVGVPSWVEGKFFVDVKRRGKAILLEMEEDLVLLVHLRMTGQLIFVGEDEEREGGGHPSDALRASLPGKHTRVQLNIEGGARLFFNDQRMFGSIKCMHKSALADDPFLRSLGPEPWDRAFSQRYLRAILERRSGSSIKSVLLDQKVVAGIGNIYADESLFLTGILPDTPAGSVKKKQIGPLIQNIRHVLSRGIEFGGVSARDYVNAEGLQGKMQEQLYVYGRAGLPCKVCGEVIHKSRVAGRGTHFCVRCQR